MVLQSVTDDWVWFSGLMACISTAAFVLADSEFLEPDDAAAPEASISRSGDPSAAIDMEDMEEEEIGGNPEASLCSLMAVTLIAS